MPKLCQNDNKMMPQWYQNDRNMMPQLCQNYEKMMPRRCRILWDMSFKMKIVVLFMKIYKLRLMVKPRRCLFFEICRFWAGFQRKSINTCSCKNVLISTWSYDEVFGVVCPLFFPDTVASFGRHYCAEEPARRHIYSIRMRHAARAPPPPIYIIFFVMMLRFGQ